MTIVKNVSCVIYCKAAQDRVMVSTTATIKEERESNYFFLSSLENIIVENNWKLDPEEMETLKKSILEIHCTNFYTSVAPRTFYAGEENNERAS